MFKINIVIPVLFILVSCGGGGGGGSAPDPAPTPMPTASISANPMSLFVDEQVAISWSSTNSTSCEASESWQGVKSTSGEEVFTITEDGSHVYKIKCTGSGGSAEASVTVSAEYKTQFKEEPIVINDPKLYPQVCNTSYSEAQPSIQFAIPVDINNDGWEDFMVHQWCDLYRDKFGDVIQNPTPDLIVVHLSNGDGTYRDGNQEVFGEDIPSLGGASRKYDRGDLNGDGRDDFAFAMNWEDGRNGDPWEYSRASPAIILSKGETEYEVVKVGTPDWGHAVTIVEHDNGNVDALFAGFTGIGLQAYRYSLEGWLDVKDEYPPENIMSEDGLNIIDIGTASWNTELKYQDNYIVATDQSTNYSERGLALWFRENNVWSKVDQELTPIEFFINQISWQGSEGPTAVYLVNGEYSIDYTPETMCFFEDKFDDSGNTTFLGLFATSFHKEGREIIEGETYNQNNFNSSQEVKVFQIQDNKMVQIESPLNIYDNQVFANFLDCRDLNNDGYTDFSRNVFSRSYGYETPRLRGGTPIININNSEGQMVEYENNQSYEMPGHELLMDAGHGQGFPRDVNGDGIEDIVVYGETMRNEFNNYDGSIHVYLGYYDFVLE
jgi:hypothetical protein